MLKTYVRIGQNRTGKKQQKKPLHDKEIMNQNQLNSVAFNKPCLLLRLKLFLAPPRLLPVGAALRLPMLHYTHLQIQTPNSSSLKIISSYSRHDFSFHLPNVSSERPSMSSSVVDRIRSSPNFPLAGTARINCPPQSR